MLEEGHGRNKYEECTLNKIYFQLTSMLFPSLTGVPLSS